MTGKKGSAAAARRCDRSLRLEFTVTIFVLICAVVLLGILMNGMLLERYYTSRKRQAMENVRVAVDAASDSGAISSDAFDQELLRAMDRNGIAIVVMDAESRTIKAYATDRETMQRRLWENLIALSGLEAAERDAMSAAVTQTLVSAPDHVLQVVRDHYTETDYMELFGILDEGSVYLLRTPLESARQSTGIANRFFMLAGLFAALAGGAAAYIVTGRMTRPILGLSEISRRMRGLDFSARYEGRERNEIGELGRNINDLSSSLEETISALKTANAELESDIRRREETDRMREEFISGVTHELKTPLAMIQGYAEGLAENVSESPEDRAFYCDVIVDESRRMNAMVNRLLTLNELTFGRVEVRMERFDLAEMIADFLSSAQILPQQEGVTVRFDPKGPAYVWADRFLTEDVLSNYFSNAVHHAAGEKVIDIRLDRQGDGIRTTVFNTGDPIPEEALPHIWEQFYKVDKARTRAYGGSGVGLSVVRAAMNLMHRPCGAGNVDGGVAFWFDLERADGEQTGDGTDDSDH